MKRFIDISVFGWYNEITRARLNHETGGSHMNLQLANNIKRLRRERNLTQDDIATELGISYQAVSRWETGASYPDVELLPMLAAIFGVSMDVLFGLDEAKEGETIRQYIKECDAIEDADEQIRLTQRYMSEFPSNTYLKYRLISRYKYRGLPISEGKLGELRRHCRYIIEHTTDMDLHRDVAIQDMIALESEDNLDEWLSALDNRSIITSEQALTKRYFYRNEIEKYNKAIQKDIIHSLTQMFSDDFCKRDAKTFKNARSRAQGQKLILQTIDVYRDPAIEVDAWIEHRMFAYMRLAAGEFGAGNIEEGYSALEKAVDLSIVFDKLPSGTELKYHCSALDLLTVVLDKSHESACGDALRMLTAPKGWEWFNKVRNEERFQKQVERLRLECSKSS